jgi:amino acid adenylation domain-containing protein
MQSPNGFLLAPQQRRIAKLQQQFGQPFYRTVCMLDIFGHVDQNHLRHSLDDLVERYEILRTSFVSLPGMALPMQVIEAHGTVHWQVLDRRQDDPLTAELVSEQLFADLCSNAANEKKTGLHVTLMLISEAQQRLFLSVPALCADNRSLDLLVNELVTRYAPTSTSELAKDPVQYVDLSTLFQEWLDSEATGAGRAFWQTYGTAAAADLTPTATRVSGTPTTFTPQVWRTPLPTSLAARLQRIAEEYQVSVSTLFLTAWLSLIYRRTQQSVLTMAVASDGRTYDELADTLGVIERQIPLSCSFQEDQLFINLARSVQQSLDELKEWQDYYDPEWVQENGLREYMPFAFGAFTSQECPENSGISIVKKRFFSCGECYKLKLMTLEIGAQTLVELHYNSTQVSATQAEAWSRGMMCLLESIAADPETRLDCLNILPASERTRLLIDWNQTTAAVPTDQGLHKLFEAQAQRTPDQVAVVFEGQRLTYRQLNVGADLLAARLQAAGVEPERPVALLLERSLEVPLAILAILKSGGAVLPLDPSYPRDRIAVILKDARPTILLTHTRLATLVDTYEGHVVSIDQMPSDFPDERLLIKPDGAPDRLAYIIYTSGSTGVPKGVMLTHQNLINRVSWSQQEYPLDENDAVLQMTSLGFDFSIWEIMAPLIAGARLVMARPGGHLDSVYMVRCILEEKVTILHFVPSLLRLFLEEPSLDLCSHSLRLVFSGGETLPMEVQERFFARCNAMLYNQYGPSETAIDSTFWRCIPSQTEDAVPIGRPIANTTIYLLDRQQHPVPVGVPGELYIGGDGVARGYLNQSAMTAERFVPNPFSQQSGSRLYKTGDLAYYRDDGTIKFLGRIDDQLKIRGNRIERGDVEATILRYPGIHAAALTVRTTSTGYQQLIAFVAGLEKNALDSSAILAFLRSQLPDFMIPEIVVILDRLPRLPNGKLDRSTLPDPATPNQTGNDHYEAPRNQLEEMLCAAWSDVLLIPQVGINKNFFDLGGHSLLAMQLILRIRTLMDLEVSVRDIFEAPTIATFAERIDALRWIQDSGPAEGLYEEGVLFDSSSSSCTDSNC